MSEKDGTHKEAKAVTFRIWRFTIGTFNSSSTSSCLFSLKETRGSITFTVKLLRSADTESVNFHLCFELGQETEIGLSSPKNYSAAILKPEKSLFGNDLFSCGNCRLPMTISKCFGIPSSYGARSADRGALKRRQLGSSRIVCFCVRY